MAQALLAGLVVNGAFVSTVYFAADATEQAIERSFLRGRFAPAAKKANAAALPEAEAAAQERRAGTAIEAREEGWVTVRSLRYSVAGLCSGTLHYFWFHFLDHLWPGAGLGHLLAKVTADTLFTLCHSALVITVASTLAQEDTRAILRQDLLPAALTTICWNTPLDFFTFSCVPVDYQAMFHLSIDALASIFTSYFTHRHMRQYHREDPNDDKAGGNCEDAEKRRKSGQALEAMEAKEKMAEVEGHEAG